LKFPDLIEIVNQTTVNGDSNFVEKQSIEVHFENQNFSRRVDSVLINDNKLIKISNSDFKLNKSIEFARNIDFKVFNYSNQNIDTIIYLQDSVRFSNLSDGDTLSKSELFELEFNYDENSYYRYEIVSDLEPEDSNYIVETYDLDPKDNGKIMLSKESLNKFPSNKYYIFALEVNESRYIDLSIDFTTINYHGKYVYYVKFYLTN
jgi:hypothetical protein